nr:hypothetical protein [Mycoplasmopsis agassizii]
MSSLTYLAVPGNSFTYGWMFAFAQLTILLFMPILIKYIVPFFRRLKQNTAYAYIGVRFHKSIRYITSIAFIIFHIFRMAIVLYIPITALTLFIDLNVYAIIFIVGALVVVSTLIGGMKAVLWADAIQGVVLLGGIVIVMIFGLAKTDWASSSLAYHPVFSLSSIQITLVSGGILFIFISNYVNTIYQYVGSQDVVQRYRSNKDIRKTNKAIWVNLIMGAITILLFYGVGSVLYSYYSSLGLTTLTVKAATGINDAATNQLLPFFIVTVLPAGLSGLLISAVFAAAQSTISSSLSALTNTIVVDFIQTLAPSFKTANLSEKQDKKLKQISLILVAVFGVIAVALAMVFARTGQGDFIRYFLSIVALLGGPTAAIFILGIFTKRTDWISALTGLILGFAVGIAFWIPTQNFIPVEKRLQLASEIWGFIPFTVSLISGYVIARILGLLKIRVNGKSNVNLTIWTTTSEFKKLIVLESQFSKLNTKLEKKYNKENQVWKFWQKKDKFEIDYSHSIYQEIQSLTNQVASQTTN